MLARRLRRLAVAGVAASAPVAWGQADFFEGFEDNGATPPGASGPGNLIDAGWIFRNQSDPVAGPAWYDGDGFGGAPFQGAGYLASSSNATDFFGGQISSWAILPPIDGQMAGDLMTIWIRGGQSFDWDTFFEIRYSGSGVGTGSGPDDIGDFTQVLYSQELPLAPFDYQRVSVVLPGDGRLAMRFSAPNISSFAGAGAFFGVDSLTVGPEGDTPCGLELPEPGQTVVWAVGDSPHEVCQDLLIPAGGRVEIEPGAEVRFVAGALLRVEGELAATGAPDTPARFTGSTGFNTGIEVYGELDLAFTELGVRVHFVGDDSAMILTDSEVGPGGTFTGVADTVVVERCAFDGSDIGSGAGLVGNIRVVDSVFDGGAIPNFGGYLHVDGITVEGAGLRLFSEVGAHPVLIEDVTVTGNTSGAGITINGPNFLIGDNVVIENNRYPLAMDYSGAGLLEGSVLPQTGNTLNRIVVPEFLLGAMRYWANTGLPYVVEGEFPANYGGQLEIAPGTNVKFGPGAGAFLVLGADLKLNGTSDEPIVLESLNPGTGRWFGLKWVDDFDARARHTIFDGGEIAVQSDGGVLELIRCTVRNSLEGTGSSTGGIVRLFGSSIVDNFVGMATTQSGRVEADGRIAPSIFEGNGVAIDYQNFSINPYLRFNWWGDPTGPTSPLNPGGMGDPVPDVHPSAYTPFLDAPPALDDDFPLVEMEPTYFMANAGGKIILRWESSDDRAVVEQRVEFAPHDFPSEFATVATLPPSATTYEFDIPEVLPNNLYTTPSAIRIVAVDDAGQESWDKSVIRIPYHGDWTPTYQDVTDPGLVKPWDNYDVCWSPGGNGDAYLLMDGIGLTKNNGGSNTGCLAIGARAPYSSTDTARTVILTTFGAGGRIAYSFSDYFEVRPDPRLGDAPPQVEVSSPAAGQSFAGGSTIPVRWMASDDEGLRSFRIQASYDGGRSWHGVKRDLPGEARAFDWDLPESSGIDDVRLRVVAFDHRFQDSSSTAGAFAIVAGSGGCNDADLAEPFGILDLADVQAFVGGFTTQDPIADLNGDGVFDLADVQRFAASFTAGCP